MRPTWRRYKASKALTSRAWARATSAVSWSRSPESMAKKVAPSTASFMWHKTQAGAERFTRLKQRQGGETVTTAESTGAEASLRCLAFHQDQAFRRRSTGFFHPSLTA